MPICQYQMLQCFEQGSHNFQGLKSLGQLHK